MSPHRMKILIGTLALLGCIPLAMILSNTLHVAWNQANGGSVIVWLLGIIAFTTVQWKLTSGVVSLFRRAV